MRRQQLATVLGESKETDIAPRTSPLDCLLEGVADPLPTELARVGAEKRR